MTILSRKYKRPFIVVVLFVYIAVVKTLLADTIVWQGGLDGEWSDTNNWYDVTLETNQIPSASDQVYIEDGGPNPDGANAAGNVYIGYGVYDPLGTGLIDQSGNCLTIGDTLSIGISGSYDQFGGTVTAGTIAIDGGYADQYELFGGTVNADAENIGISTVNGSGKFLHNGGNNNVGTLSLGMVVGAFGYYSLFEGTLINASDEYIGLSGNGSFTQSGGANIIMGYLEIGSFGTSIYSLSGGVLTAYTEDVDGSGIDKFIQTGGTNTLPNGFLNVGLFDAGSYFLLGGTLTPAAEEIGENGMGSFTQSGGTHTVTGELDIGSYTGSVGTYSLSGGTLTCGQENIGNSGSGLLNQSGGKNTTPVLIVEDGTYNLSFGTLDTSEEYIGFFQSGSFTQTGGTSTVSNLFLSSVSGYGSAYSLAGGTLNAFVENISGYFTQSGGTNSISSNLWVTSYAGATNRFALNGGVVNSTSTSIDNGLIFTDGDGVDAATYNLVGGVHSFANGLEVRSNATLSGCGTINGDILVDFGGTIIADCGTLTLKGSITNDGLIQLVNGSTLAVYGQVTNNGTLDVVDGTATNSAGSLQVNISPSGLSVAQWQVDGGIPQSGGTTVLGLSVGNHTVSFSTIAPWTTPPDQTISVSANQTTTATGVYTEPLQFEFTFTTNADNTLTITGYTGPGGAVNIPTNINGLLVSSIGDYAFYYYESITSLTIPNGVTSIGFAAFYACSSLTNVIIGNDVTSIGEDAFSYCYSLTGVYFQGNAPPDLEAFYGDPNTTIYYLPGSSGWEATFGGVPAVILNPPNPNGSVQVIINPSGLSAAQWQVDGGLLQPGGATVLGLTVGNHTVSFTTVGAPWTTPPDQIISVNANSVTTATGVYTEPLQFEFAFTTNADNTLTITGYTGPGGAVNIPTNINGLTVTAIGQRAFFYAGSMTSVTIPNTISSIGFLAFYESGIFNAVFEDGVTSIGEYAFYFCPNLCSVTIPASVTNIAFYAFADCPLLDVLFEGNAPIVDPTAFNYDYDVTVYYLPGTSGWSSPFEGFPTFMLNPPIPAASLEVTIIPAGAVASGAQWQVDGGLPQPSGATVLGLTVGNHIVSVNDVSGWITPGNQSVMVASNQTTTATVTYIGIPPSILTQPSSPSPTEAGLFATFTVQAAGSPPLCYQWLHNGIPLSHGGDFSGTHSATLTVDPLGLDDAGAYSVTVSNAYGSTNSYSVGLSVFASTNGIEDFQAGTNYVARGDFTLANLSFSNALNLAPNNLTNLFFYAASGLLSLPEQPAGSNFLSRIGFGSAGRDVFNWKAQASTNLNGHLEVPAATPPLNADEFTAQLRTNVLPAIIAAQATLAEITPTNFNVCLTSNETHANAVMVDLGDVQMLEAICDTAELFIYTVNSMNVDIQLATTTNVYANDGGIESLLTNYPSLLTTTSTADLPAARSAFTNAINEYFAASAFIRSRPPGETRLFNLDTNRTEEEFQFRETLSNLLASLNGPVPLTVKPCYSVSAQAFFSGNFDLRSYLPQFQGDEFVWNSFPDTNFGGIISGLTETEVGQGVIQHLDTQTVLNLPGTSLSVLYNFTNFSDQTGVVQGADGNLYGTMMYGGPFISLDPNGVGFGSIFRITTNGQFDILYSFGSVGITQTNSYLRGTNIYYYTDYYPIDGAYPNPLTVGRDGNFYGTTTAGGFIYFTNVVLITNVFITNNVVTNVVITNLIVTTNFDNGTVFKLSPSGQLTTLYDFNNEDSSSPSAPLVQGTDGLFYGTTEYGGSGSAGTVFAISTEGSFNLLASFPTTTETNVYFYENGGVTNIFVNYETVDAQGAYPATPLIQGSDGNFYGTTTEGGIALTNIATLNGITFTNLTFGYGTIYQITPAGQMTTLYTFGTQQDEFGDPLDGATPNGLLQGVDGNLYGTTQYGGSNDDNIGLNGFFGSGFGSGDGTLFQISPTNANSFITIISFDQNFPDGYYPIGSLVAGPKGSLYGVASGGGANNKGAVFALNTTNGIATNLVWLNRTSGDYGENLQSFQNFQSYFIGPGNPVPLPTFLTSAIDGKIYGTTTDDGDNGSGTVYILNTDAAAGAPTPPLLQTVGQSNGTLTFSWSSVPGQTYQVQYINDLAGGTWKNLGGPMLAGSATLSTSDGITNVQQFYRIVRLP